MSRLLIIEDKHDIEVQLHADGTLSYDTPWFRVDGDGDPHNTFHDPCWQADTSLHGPDGRPVNALFVPYAVANPIMAQRVPGIVLGCEAEVTFRGITVKCVMADIGPRKKIGEGSIRLAELLGMKRSPLNGGQEGEPVHWKIYPGKAAVIDGIHYALKPLKG